MTSETRILQIKKDDRGELIELIKPEDIGGLFQGQVFLTTAKPGKIKGNHYHLRKTEWYCVIKGQGKLTLIDIHTKEKQIQIVSSEKMELVTISPNIFHSIENIGEEDMYLIVYVSEEFNSEDSDTFYEFI